MRSRRRWAWRRRKRRRRRRLVILPTYTTQMKYLITLTISILLFLWSVRGSRDLILSEVYLKGNADWIEISNVGDEIFSGTITLSGATTPWAIPEYFNVDNLVITSGQSVVVARYGLASYDYFQNIWVIGAINSKLTLSATGRDIGLWYQDMLLDEFVVDYATVHANDITSSFSKKEKFWPVSVSLAQDSRNVIPGYIASPWIYIVPIIQWDISTGDISTGNISTGEIDTGTSTLCIQNSNQLRISEIYLGDENYSPFIELQGLSDFQWPVMLSGSLLGLPVGQAGLSFTFDVNITHSGFLIVSRGDNWLLAGPDKIVDTRLDLLSWAWTLSLSRQDGQVLDIVQITPSGTKKSFYPTQNDGCKNIFSEAERFSPGFDERFLYYFSGSNSSTTVVINSTWSCPICPATQNTCTSDGGASVTSPASAVVASPTTSGINSAWQSNLKIISIDLSTNPTFQTITIQSNQSSATTFSSSSPYRLHSTNRSTNNVLNGTVSSWESKAFTGNWRFPTTPNCIELLSGTAIIDTYCYGQQAKSAEPPTQPNTSWSENTDTIKLQTWQIATWLLINTPNTINPTIKITSIDYDPQGSDTNNEKITLQLISGESLDLSWLRLKIGDRVARIYWTLNKGSPQTFIGNYRLPNTSTDKKDISVSLISGDYIFDTYYYNPEKPEWWLYDISSVIDGDTVRINYKGKIQSVRLLWIDAPESNKERFGIIQCYGPEAKKYLTTLLQKKNISLEFDPSQNARDSYERFVGYIYLDWKNINQQLIQEWYAKEFTRKNDYQKKPEFLQSQELAKNQNIWIWKNCGWIVSGEIPQMDFSDYSISIKNIIYDPAWKDENNESITLEVFTDNPNITNWELALSAGFSLNIDNKKKSLKSFWALKIWWETTLTGTFGFVNTRAICIEIANGEQVFDKYCYDPSEDNTLWSGVWKSYSGLTIQIKNILPNPSGKDEGKEEVGLFIDRKVQAESGLNNPTGINLSDWFYLLINNREKKLTGNILLAKDTQLSWSFNLPNKASCVSIGQGDKIFDKFCYTLPKDDQRFVLRNWVIENMTDQDFWALSVVTLKQIDNRLCVIYMDQEILCRNIPAGKTSIKLKNENKLYKNYITMIEWYLQKDWAILLKNTKLWEYLSTFKDAKKALKKWQQKIQLGDKLVDIYDLKEQLALKYELSSIQHALIDLPDILKHYISFIQEYESRHERSIP